MDPLGAMMIQLTTVTAVAMGLTEKWPLGISEPPWRKRITVFVYSFVLAGMASAAGLITHAEGSIWWQRALALFLAALASSVLSWGVVTAFKKTQGK